MNCITPPGLDDRQIVSYVDGEADDTVKAHIEKCSFCRQKADQWRVVQKKMRMGLYRHNCPSSMELGEYHLGLLPPPQKLVVTQHLRECPVCRREVAQLEEFLDDSSLMLKDNLLAKTKVLVAKLVGGQSNEMSGAPAFATLRGKSKGPLIFEADDVVITLDIRAASNEQLSILGQVAADDQDNWTGAEVVLQQIDLPDMITSVDDLGAFHFELTRLEWVQITVTPSHRGPIRVLNDNIKT